MSVDAIAYTPSDRTTTSRTRAASADADLAAVVRRAIAERERRRREAEGLDPAADVGTSPDLLTLPSSAASMDDGSGVDLALGGVSLLPPLAPRSARRSVAVGGAPGSTLGGVVDLAAGRGIEPGGDGAGPGAIGEASLDAGPANLSLSSTIGRAGPASLGISPFSGLTFGVGGRAGSVGVTASPVSGVNVGVTATPSENSGVNLALASALRAAGIPLSLAIAKGLLPAAAAFAGPAGLAVQGFNSLVDLSTGVARAFGEPTVRSIISAMRGNDPETNAAILNNAATALAVAQSGGYAPVGVEAAAVLAMQLNSFNPTLAVFGNARDGFVVGPAGTNLNQASMDPNNPSASNPANFNNTTNFGRGADDASGPVSEGVSPAVGLGAVGPSPGPVGGLTGLDMGDGASGTGGGVGGGAGPSGTGEAPFLATWAMQGLGIGPDERRERGWAAFKKSFDKRFPLTGEAQFRRYARLARQVVEALEQRPLPEQRLAQRMIYARIVAPLGETLELHEVDEAWTAMRATALLLAKRLGLTVDPADVPQPVHEVAARARQRQQERVRRAREQHEADSRS